MALKKVRSYRREVLDKLFALEDVTSDILLHSMGSIHNGTTIYPLYYLTVGGKDTGDLKDILISAGIHGEEPAGVYALLRFLEDGIEDFRSHYRFLIFPCINPFGFEHNYRFNPQPDANDPTRAMDINRQFKSESQCMEAVNVMRVLEYEKTCFTCHIDLHETDPNWSDEGFEPKDNPCSFYMWETCPDTSMRVGDKVVAVVEGFAPVCKWPFIFKDTNSGGVIWYPEGCSNPHYAQGTTLDAFVNADYSPQTFTLETPCDWSINQRVFIHNVALRTILELKRGA